MAGNARRLTPDQGVILKKIQLNKLDQNLFGGDDYNIFVDREEFNSATILEQSVCLQEFYYHLQQHRNHPKTSLEQHVLEDIEKCKKCDTNLFRSGNAFTFFPRHSGSHWYRLVQHFFSTGGLPRFIWQAIKRLAKTSKLVPFNTIEAIRRAEWQDYKHTYNPMAYRTILDSLDIKRGVIDLHPELGHKALACAFGNTPYYCLESQFQTALDRNICGITGLDYEPLDKQQVDLIISDRNFECFDTSGTKPYLQQSKRLMAFAPGKDKPDIVSKYKPSRVIKVHTLARDRWLYREPNYLVIW